MYEKYFFLFFMSFILNNDLGTTKTHKCAIKLNLSLYLLSVTLKKILITYVLIFLE